MNAPRAPACTARGRARDGFLPPRGALWVFGYGSLMWNPGFVHERAQPALLRGYHRAFCLYSVGHRGTREKPGLVLGLNRGGACRGMVYRVAAHDVHAVLDVLWEREMPHGTYVPRAVRVERAGGAVRALAFVANTRHAHFAGDLAFDDTAQIIACCSGERGHNAEYLCNTVRHLEQLGIRDVAMHRLYQRVLDLQTVQR